MITFLLLAQTAVADVPKTIPLPHIRGKELYDDLCFQCHGVNGLADTPLATSTKAPKLAGQFSEETYAAGIEIVQQGKGTMPAYEMVIDKHDSKRILIYLGGLDPETGIDPRIKETEDDATSKKESKSKPESSKLKAPKNVKPALEKTP